jgi:hypothetical protein
MSEPPIVLLDLEHGIGNSGDEAAAKARHAKSQIADTSWEKMNRRYREAKIDVMRECVEAADRVRGLKEERRSYVYDEERGAQNPRIEQRYVTGWRLGERPS